MPASTCRYQHALAWLDQHAIRPFYTNRVRRLSLQGFPFWIASLLTGLVAVGYEKVFGWAEQVSCGWPGRTPWLERIKKCGAVG